MAKIRLSIEERKDIFLYDTKIENLFINEFLPDAPGDYVKVYLFGLMYAQFDQAADMHTIAMQLGLSENEVWEAWIYWESQGIVSISSGRDDNNEELRTVRFVRQIDMLYGKSQTLSPSPQAADTPAYEGTGEFTASAEPQTEGVEYTASDAAAEDVPAYVSIDDMDYDEVLADKLVDRELRAIYQKFQATARRTVSRHETEKIRDAMAVYGIKPEIFSYAIDYCADLRKYSVDYIFKVALRWTEEGCQNTDEVKALLEKHSMRNSWYGQVFKALGFSRMPAPADRELMDRWFDEMGYTLAEVIDACNASVGVREPNMRYVNKVLENRRLEKGGVNTRLVSSDSRNEAAAHSEERGSLVSRRVLSDYFEYIRSEGEKEQKERISEVIRKIPEMKDVFEKEGRINSRLLSLRPGGESRDERQELRAKRLRLESDRKALLESYGYPADYLNRRYRCDRCRDTGYTDEGMVCSCCRERAEEAYVWIGEKDRG